MALDPYEQLGIPRDSSSETIKAAWRSKAQAMHPDKHPGDPYATTRFQLLKEAYETLADPERRKAFDATGNGDTVDLQRRGAAILTMVIQQAIDDPGVWSNIVDQIHAMLNEGEKNGHKTVRSAEAAIARLKAKLRTFKYKGRKDDVLTISIQHRIDKHEAAAAGAKRGMEEIVVARALFQDYERDDGPMERRDNVTGALTYDKIVSRAKGYLDPWSTT